MRRELVSPRPDWQKTVESQGLTFHSRTTPYWNEGACYSFSSREIDKLEKAGNDVHEMCLAAAQQIIDKDFFRRLAIEPELAEVIVNSWNNNELHFYGRFDFAYDGTGEPKLLEYNADTPTSLLEASIVQWYWLRDKYPKDDQFNSLHERMIERWKKLGIKSRVDFVALKDMEEDIITVNYIRDTALQSGLDTQYLNIQDVGYNSSAKEFRDLNERKIDNLFKLYPWEWLANEDFGEHLYDGKMRVIEPAWKMMWSNKGILPILWEMFPGHPNLLPCYESPNKLEQHWVKKPLLSREGANVTVCKDGVISNTPGEYGEEGHIYQAFQRINPFGGKTPILGLWMIGDECRGMGIRESNGIVTDNLSQFTPHYFY